MGMGTHFRVWSPSKVSACTVWCMRSWFPVVIRARGKGSESLSTRLRWGMLLRVIEGFA